MLSWCLKTTDLGWRLLQWRYHGTRQLSLNAGNTVGCYWKLYFSSNGSHLLRFTKWLRGHVYSNFKEKIISEDMCDTISASPSCLYKYLRRYPNTWVPFSVGAAVLFECIQDVPASESLYVGRGNDCLRTACLNVFLALPRGLSMC